MVTATAILVAIAHDGSIGLALCLIEFPVPKKNPLSCTSENGKCYVNFMDMNLNAKRKDKEYQFLMVYLHALPFDLETCAKEIQEILFT